LWRQVRRPQPSQSSSLQEKTTMITSYRWSIGLVGLLCLGLFHSVGFAGIAIAQDDFVGYWSLDEGSGTLAADDSGNNYDGTLGSNATWEGTGYLGGNALTVNGTAGSHINVADVPGLSFGVGDDYTVAFWVQMDTLPGAWQAMLWKGSSAARYAFFVTPNGNIQFTSGSFSSIRSPASAVAGDWQHVVGIQEAGHPTRKRRLYINGVEVAASSTAQPADGAGDLFIGSRRADAYEAFAGDLDEVRIYSRALSDSEVTSLAEESESPPDDTAPSNPTGLSATAISDTAVDLTWTASTDNVAVAGYYVYLDGNYIAPVATVTTTSHTVTGLAPITAYSFEVTAFDASDNESGLSNVANATTQAPPPPPSGQELRPNLRVMPAYDLNLSRTQLRFSTMSYNVGIGPLEVRPGETGSAGQNVRQRVYYSDGSYYERVAGNFTWHPEHGHTHFDNYFWYGLQPVAAPGASQREGHKTTFCLIDTDHVEPGLPGSPNNAAYETCNLGVQGISVGWGDEYYYWLPDQDIDVTGLPNGDYELTMEVDPQNRLIEVTDDDNVAAIFVRLNFDNNTVTVIDSPGDPGDPPITVTVGSIWPSVVYRNSVELVTISGAGFAPGMSVSLENGSGPAPTVRNVVIVDDSTITAQITIKKGGGKRGAVWDVRVGSAVLIDALTVLP
jgi:hypothetical protein